MGHNHSCACEHNDVRFCKHCQTVYCRDCNQEWTLKSQYWYPWYSHTVTVRSNEAYKDSTGSAPNYTLPTTNTVLCNH